MNKLFIFCVCIISVLTSCSNPKPGESKINSLPKADLKLPDGFSASIVADSLGALRHLAVTSQGDIYVKLNSLKDGKGIYFLADTNHDGSIDRKIGFAGYPGTGILINNGELYSSSNSGVFKYKLDDKGMVTDTGKPEVIVSGLVDRGRDNSKSIAIGSKGDLFVTVGSYNETCREKDSGKGIPGCPLLDSVGGVWKFKTNKTDQSYGDAVHYTRGLKNVVGIDWNNATNSLFVMQHGRGAFDDKFPQYYTPKQSAELPAETMYELHEGADAGWPFVYYDQFQKKKMLAPEYGGDGKKAVQGKYLDPIAAFPAHLGPNDLLFYTGKMFPEKYRNGAFIVFHGQSPQLKKGYLVAFVPFKNGKPSGEWEIFADNFAGFDLAKPNGAALRYRPMGLAQGPDGALYVSDDLKGAIFKITYQGSK
ncbi:PQQ-dependent sugar dehydrogenase [Mucilaginibacter ginsenosidivorans]|uniref:Sorbosone dehydrogenase n=1 Tax=Mucilaginibacter ginsenosidivorans TaxID=398053 RepID=A0A5B8US95_9SPHI|nr:PQQ-dependent sugar dehydrogenase [Mucilaginibacter ginsenosidivorans]QEC61839.1 sorbosone dehydrogenase [Mucilaginibacter ginsenosidivorans]